MSVAADYLQAIGLPDAINGKPNLELLQRIYTAHGEKLAFSSINVLQGEPVKMRAPTALESIAVCKRGGVCCEHCPLMLRALQELGYDARLRAGEVMLNGEYTARWGHRTVWVECEGATYMLDVSSLCHYRRSSSALHLIHWQCICNTKPRMICALTTACGLLCASCPTQVGFPAKPVDIVKVVADVEQLQSNGVVIVMTQDADQKTWYLNTKSTADGELTLLHRIHMQDEYKLEELDETMQCLEAASPTGVECAVLLIPLLLTHACERPSLCKSFLSRWANIVRKDKSLVTVAQASSTAVAACIHWYTALLQAPRAMPAMRCCWAGHTVPVDQAKYVVRPPHTAEPIEELIPVSSDRIAQLFKDEFHLSIAVPAAAPAAAAQQQPQKPSEA
eukprot:3314-Heterococcus_DN1.PRE.2